MAQLFAQNCTSEKLGPYGSKYPENYSFQLEDGETIKEVIIRHGFIVDAIGFVVAKPRGGTYTKIFGGNCGNESKIVLKPGEKISRISGTFGNYKYLCNKPVVATMKIHTNLCPNGYGTFGQGMCVESATNFVMPLPTDGHAIIGVFGRHNNYLESLGIIVKKMSHGVEKFGPSTDHCQGKEVHGQANTRATVTNNGVDTVKFQEKKDWSGTMQSAFPRMIGAGQNGTFLHQGKAKGSMGAVVYTGPNEQGGPDDCAWVFAWSVHADSANSCSSNNNKMNKVYVVTGPTSKYGKNSINWNAIKYNLQYASNEGRYYDQDSNTEIIATIDKYGSNPSLNVTFEVNDDL